MGQDLVPLLREESFLGILLLLIDCMSDEFLCLCMLSHFSCVQLCDLMDWSPQGSSVRGILQARILEWVAISSSRGSS